MENHAALFVGAPGSHSQLGPDAEVVQLILCGGKQYPMDCKAGRRLAGKPCKGGADEVRKALV